MTTIGIANTLTNAKYFPNTISPTETGDVYNNWSVLFFCSSDKLLIVSTGTKIKNKKVTEDNVMPSSGYPIPRL